MKSLKIFFLAALVAVAGVFTACTEDGDWSVGKPEKGTRVFFSNENTTSVTATADATSVPVTIARNETVGALEVSVSATFGSNDYASFFTVPQTVIFNDGMATTTVTIDYDFSKLVGGESYDITLTVVDETLHTNYGYAEQTITVVCPEPWVLLGSGIYRDDLIPSIFDLGGFPEYYVQVYENTNKPGFIYMKNPYGESYPVNASNFTSFAEDVYFAIDVRNPDAVVIPEQPLGLNVDPYGDVWVRMSGDNVGTYKDGIITFAAKTMEQAMTAYQGGSYDYLWGNASGMFRLVMPGVELTDYAMSIAYGGMQVAADNTTVSAVLNGTYGADVASMRYAFFEGDVAGAAAQAAEIIIAAAEEEVGVMEFEQGLEADARVFSFLESKLAAPGSYTVFCVPYNADGEPQAAETAAATFYFPGMGGAEIPDCELICGLFPFSYVFGPDYAAQYPDSSTLAALVAGVDIASCRYGFITGLGLADLGFEGDVEGETAVAVQDFVTEALGESSTDGWMYAFDAEDIADINSEQGLAVFFKNLPASTSCTLFVEGKNSYGKSQVYASSGATTAEGVQAESMSQENAAKVGQYVLKTRRTPGQALKAHTLKK